jgi:hypothetical protein
MPVRQSTVVNRAALKAPVFNASTTEECTIAMEKIGGVTPVSAVRPIAKTPTGRSFAPKALGRTLVLR